LTDARQPMTARRAARLADTRRSTASLVGAIVAVATYILLSGRLLPAYVASHFAGDGTANGYMPRSAYVAFMLVVTISLPLVIFASARILPSVPPSLLNLPHREYWLAMERRDATYAYLSDHTAYFATLLAVFLGFVHWRVVAANGLHPPVLEPVAFVAGLIVFLVALVAWIAVLAAHFRRNDPKRPPRRSA
jgi:uncharacterized membrane protein